MEPYDENLRASYSSAAERSSYRVGSAPSLKSTFEFGEEEGMSTEMFRKYGHQLVDFICQYVQEVDSKQIHPFVMPGFLLKELPSSAPREGEDWPDILEDIEEKIIPGITHWTHKQFHAYEPSSRSFPSIMGDALSSALGCIGMTWYSCPAYTELEVVVLDWFAKALGLPAKYLHSSGRKKGGGGFQPSESDAVLISMLAARYQRTKGEGEHDPGSRGTPSPTTHRPTDEIDEAVDRMRVLTAYCSTEAHSCVQKAARLCMVQLRVIDADRSDCLNPERLRQAIEADVAQGLVPFWVVATIGTYATAASDNLQEIGAVCEKYPTIWLHVDASYGGNALLCPEMRYLSLGIEHAHSISVCPEKWALVNSDCTCFYTSDYLKFIEGLVINPTYLQHEHMNESIDFRHWGVPLSRRFRALKLWFTMRSYGLHNMQKHIRRHCLLAERFRAYITSDRRLQLMNHVEIHRSCKCQPSGDKCSQLGVVSFRVLRTGDTRPLPADQLTQLLLAFINHSGRAFMSPVRIGDHFCIRYCISAANVTHEDVDRTARLVDRCLEKIEHAQYMSMARSMTEASLGSLGLDPAVRRAISRTRSQRRSADRPLQLQALRYLTHTASLPPYQMELLRAQPQLQGPDSPSFVPEADDDIVDHVDLSDLVATLEL